MPPDVSVIVPVYNDSDGLRRCLEALSAQTLAASRFEVLVVDNGSSEDPAPLVSPFEFARLLREREPGSYRARNRGIAMARSARLGFTDADCLPAPDWIERALERLPTPEVRRVVGGRVDLFAQNPKAPTWAESYDMALGFRQATNVRQRRFSVTANLFTTRATLEAVGDFDAARLSGGDKEWGQRAHALGVELVYADDVVVRHAARHDLSELRAKRRRMVGGQLHAARERYPSLLAHSLVFGKACLPPAARFFRARRLREGALSARALEFAKLWAVASLLQVDSAVEVLRLGLGAKSRR
jgi:glycosyltransferase involved in cell wall biosynthesis